MDPRTPVLVGAAAVTQRDDDPMVGLGPVDLMGRALEAAAADTGVESLLTQVDQIAVPVGTWAHPNAAGVLARRYAPGARTVRSELGVLQSGLINGAAAAIAAGEADVAVVVGGEAKFRALRATITGVELPAELDDADVAAPDVIEAPSGDIIHRCEIEKGLVQAVHHYAMIENALRCADGLTVAAHRAEVAGLQASFSAIAASNPDAWNREPMTASEIDTAGPKNKPLAFPYWKWHNSQWNVDQAAALVLMSVAKAEALGIARDRWVFPLAGADSNHMVPVLARGDLGRCQAFEQVGIRISELASVSLADVDHADLYSCFPVAVRIQARELGLPAELPRTVTGGMTFGGGPFNNYVLQSTAKMIEVLRADPGSTGLVTAISGMLTKQGGTLWSTAPGSFAYADVSDRAAEATPTRPVDPSYTGPATVATSTVLYEGLEPNRGVAIVDTPTGSRVLTDTVDPAIIASMIDTDWCGRTVEVGPGGVLDGR